MRENINAIPNITGNDFFKVTSKINSVKIINCFGVCTHFTKHNLLSYKLC